MIKDYETLNELVKEYKNNKDLYAMVVNTIRFFDLDYRDNRKRKETDWSPTPIFEVLAYYKIKRETNNSYQMCSVDNMVDLVAILTKADKTRIRKLLWKGHYEQYYGIFAPAAVRWSSRITGIRWRNDDLKVTEYSNK